VIGNTIDAFAASDNEIFIRTTKGKETWKKGKKEDLADIIFDHIPF
jgi:hypothetical protein